jgi:hypothetical protein
MNSYGQPNPAIKLPCTTFGLISALLDLHFRMNFRGEATYIKENTKDGTRRQTNASIKNPRQRIAKMLLGCP